MTNIHQARLLADKCGWVVAEYGLDKDYWTVSFHKDGVAAVHAKYSLTGRLTKLEANDFVTGTRLAPKHDKGTYLSHFLTEGPEYIRSVRAG